MLTSLVLTLHDDIGGQVSELISKELLAEARIVAEEAYAPYSLFRVGAVAVAEDGRRFIEVNVENAAYGSTICAEATALASAATAGVRSIPTIAIGGRG